VFPRSGCRRLSGGRSAGSGLFQHLSRIGRASAATGSNAELLAQCPHGPRSLIHRLADLSFGHGIAEANVHGGTRSERLRNPSKERYAVMRMIVNRLRRSLTIDLFSPRNAMINWTKTGFRRKHSFNVKYLKTLYASDARTGDGLQTSCK
jgi:hypothetical protein